MSELDDLALDRAVDELPPPPVPPQAAVPLTRPKGRPTTRAGRRAAAAERKTTQGRATKDKPPAGKPPKQGDVAGVVAALHELAGNMLCPIAGLPSTGAALVASAQPAGAVFAQLAVRYPALAKLFTGTGDGMLFVQLAMAYLPVLLAVQSDMATPKDVRRQLAAQGMAGAMGDLAQMFSAASAAPDA